MNIRILFNNGVKTRWLGVGESYTIESLERFIGFYSIMIHCQGVGYQLEFKHI